MRHGCQGTPDITIGRLSAAPGAGHRDTASRIRVDARLLGPFQLHIDGQPVLQRHGNRGRMLLAYLLLHRSRPLGRDTLGGVFWPDAAPDIARNRLHVALYGLRRDLRTLSEHPIVVHGQAGFSFHHDVDLWLDTEAFYDAVGTARREEAGRTEVLRPSQPASSGGASIPSMRAAAPRRTRAESGGAHAATVRANPQTPARVIAGLVIARPE